MVLCAVTRSKSEQGCKLQASMQVRGVGLVLYEKVFCVALDKITKRPFQSTAHIGSRSGSPGISKVNTCVMLV